MLNLLNQLGGPDYRSGSMFETAAITARDGYKYFGATRELKSVQALLQNQKVVTKTRKPTRLELTSIINPTYYGFKDEVSMLNLLLRFVSRY